MAYASRLLHLKVHLVEAVCDRGWQSGFQQAAVTGAGEAACLQYLLPCGKWFQ